MAKAKSTTEPAGDNPELNADTKGNALTVAGDRLKGFFERIERLEEEKAAIGGDIKEVYAEAKAVGFETKIMRMIVKLRKMDAQERSEQSQLLEVYMHAIGMDLV